MKSHPHNCIEWISSSTSDTEQVGEKAVETSTGIWLLYSEVV